MKKKQIEDIFENTDFIKQKTKPAIRKSSLAPPGMNPHRDMYKSPSLEMNITTFNVINPGAGTGNVIMSTHNPSLLAISKRAKSTIRPKVKPSITFPSVTQGVTSLLSKKPLSDLPDPTKEYFEKNQKREELERTSLSFDEDPIAYFSKRKDGRGHLFIYMKYKKSRQDPDFSPYELVKVPFSDVGKDYFTMSASGVTHIDEFGNTENTTLDRWAKEESSYLSIKKLKTFRLYFLWKPLRVWKNFVQQMHFQEKLSLLVKQTFFYHISFSKVATTVSILISASDSIVTKFLLPFEASKKFTVFEFNQYSQWNFEELQKQHKKLIDKVTDIVGDLYSSIDDPKLLHVDDSDFKEIKRKNPNITQLMILEQKKENERVSRTQKMETEITAITGFLRMLDYLVLENLRRSCYEAFKNADLIVSSDLSAIFTIEVSFSDDGDIVFTPNKEGMLDIVDKMMNQALDKLDSLPRLTQMLQLRDIFTKSGIDLSDLNLNGPSLRDILETAPNIKEATDHIKEVISTAYDNAYSYSQNLVNFYPLYKIGKNWDVRDYIKKRNGEKYTGTGRFSDERDPNESNDAFLINSEEEPIIDFETTIKIIEKLRSEAAKVEEIRLGTVRGPLYIDSKKLKAELMPICSRSIKSLETTFSELVSSKITMLNSVFQSFSAKMNQDPNSLDLYVDFSHIVQKTSDLLPQMTSEINFIDEVVSLFDKVKFSIVVKNPLHPIFDKFKSDQKKSLQIREKLEERFKFVLEQLIKKKELQIQNYKSESIDELPSSIVNLDLENFFKQTLKLKKKCESLEEPIEKMKFQQKVLNLNITSFDDFVIIKHNIAFSEKIYQLAKYWSNLNNQITTIPFAHISMNEFTDGVNGIQVILDELKDMNMKESPILNELQTSFSKISPYVKQLTQLNNGKMHTRHWESLFELCGHKGEYSISVTIQNMLDNDILSNEEIINEIEKTSLSESQLDNEFQMISAHWGEVTVPFLDHPSKVDDQLLLGDLSNLLNSIKITSEKLNKMLSNRFVKGIEKQVLKLSKAMALFMNIFDQWQIFQNNWKTVSTLFSQGIVRQQLPHQTTRYEIIRKKWQDIIQHSLTDNKIFHVCSYTNMLEDFIENNKSLEIILDGISEFLNSKRELIPRLYFLSNHEVLTLLSTKDFAIFTKQIIKIMMKVQRLDFNTSDENESTLTESELEGCNFIGLKIFGVVGEDGDTLPFTNAIQCPGSVDHWMPQIFEMMEMSTKESLSISLARFASSSLTDWAMTVSCSIAMLTLQISFARDVEDCFNNLEANPRSFSHFETKLKHQIHDLVQLMSSSLSPSEQWKISFFIGLILNHYESARAFQEKIPSYSHIEAWHDMIKFKYDPTNANVIIVVGDNCWTRGNEYWGRVPRLIFTPGVTNALTNIFISKENNQIPLIFSSPSCGKMRLLEIYSYIMGRFCYTFNPFPNIQQCFIRQVMIGASLTGCSIIFKNIDQFKIDNQVRIFDYVREMNDNSKSFKFGNDENNELKIHPDFSVMFSATEKYSTEMSPQLRDYVRPIGLSIVDIRKLTESSLFSSGFKTARKLAAKLDDLTKTVISLFSLNPTRVKHIIQIVIDGHHTLIQLMHKTKVDGIDYFKEPKVAEKYSISRAAFYHFKVLIDPEKQDLLLVLLYSTFHLFNDIELFTNSLISSHNFYNDKASLILKKNVENSINQLNFEVPSDYFLVQAESLMEMMLKYPLIIICGPSNSGKSLILELLSDAFAAMLNEADLINNYRGLMQFKIESIYHQSDTFDNIFGSIENDDKWLNGLFQSTIANLEQFSKTHHRILRFDGILTPELDKFCCQFVSNQEKFKLNNLGSFSNDSCFHCIIETDDISNISPYLLNSSAVLTMNSVQHSSDHLNTQIDLLKPSIPFSMIKKEFGTKFNEDEYSIIYSIFERVSTVFVKKFQIDFSVNCARYCLNYLIDNRINCMNEELVLIVMSISFYTCYCSYSNDSHSSFSDWVIERFSLSVPNNWEGIIDEDELETINEKENQLEEEKSSSSNKLTKVSSTLKKSSLCLSNRSISTSMSNLSGMTSMSIANDDNISPVFFDYFEKPTLESIKVEDDKIVPIDASFLNERIIVEGCQFADDFIVPNAQHLSAYSTFKIAMKSHSHIFLNGPLNSGKSAMLKFIFSKSEEICPVMFNVSTPKGCSIQMIINKIKEETTLMKKTIINESKIYALVFNDLTPENINVVDFIRQLLNENKIILTSKIDTNYYDAVNIDPEKFFVIVRSETTNYDKRFLKHFFLVNTEEYIQDTKMYIANKAMGALGISIEMIQLLVYIFEKMNYSLSEMINTFIIFANINVSSIDTIRVLMTSIYFNRFNIDKEKEFDTFLDEIKNDSLKFPMFQDGLIHFKEKKNFARSIQNVTSEVLTIDRDKIKEFISKEMNSSVYDESVHNFIQIDHSIGAIGHDCIIYSSTASSQMTLLKLVCKFQDSVLFEVTDISSIKEFINKLIDDEGNHVHVLLMRKISNSLIYSILNIFKSFIFHSIYKDDEIISLSRKVFKIEDEVEIDQKRKSDLFNRIKKLIRFNCRIVALPSNSLDKTTTSLLRDFDVINLIEPTMQSICLDLIKQDEKNLEIVLIQIFESIQKYLPYSNITLFYDFVSSFIQYMSGDMKNQMSKNDEVNNALNFLDKLSIENSVFSEKLNQIQPDLEKLKTEAETSRSSYQSKNDVISMRKLKLSEEKMHLTTNLENKIEEMKQAESDMEQLVPNVEISIRRVKDLKQADIDPIRITESDPYDSLKLMLEAVAVLIGVPNTSYESFGHSLLMDEMFVHRIVDNFNYKQVTSATYDKLISYINDEKMSKKELETVAPVLVILRDLLEAICAYTARNNIYRDKKLQVEMTRRSLTDFEIDMKRELDSIRDIENQLDDEQKKLMQIQTQYNEIQKQYEEIEKQKNKIDSILKDDSKLKEFWSKEVVSTAGNGDTMVGDSILMAVYITFAGMLDNEQRRALLQIAENKIRESSLVTSFSHHITNHNKSCLQSIYVNDDAGTNDCDLWLAVTSRLIAEGVTNESLAHLPRSALIDFKHLEVLQKVPLVIDPDRAFIELFDNSQMTVISLFSSSYQSAVIECLQEGKLLIVTDVNEYDQRITEIISYSKISIGSQIIINQKTVVKHENFRVILISSFSEIEQIPNDLNLRVAAVNISSSSMETIHTEIVNSFVSYFDPSLMPKIIELQKSELAHHVQVKQYELEILNCISLISSNFRNRSENGYLNDDETIEKLLKNKELFFEATGVEESAVDIKNELEKVTYLFKPLITIVETFWICLSRYLPKVKSYYRFSFKAMMSIIKDVFDDSNLKDNLELTDDQMCQLTNNLISGLLQWLHPMISINDSLFFLFLTAFMLKDENWDDLTAIIQNLSVKINSKLTFQGQLNLNEIESLIEKLKDCEICDFFNLVKEFVSSYFGDQFENDLPLFSVENCVPSSSQIASFIISDPNSKECGPIREILKYVKKEGKLDNFECLSLSDNDSVLNEIQTKIQLSFNRGKWVLLNYSKPSKKTASVINDILYITSKKPLQSGFKLFVCCYSTDFISSQLLSKSKIITMSDFPSIRQNMLQLYHDNMELLDTFNINSSRSSRDLMPNTNLPKIIKRAFYIGALIYSQIKNRAFLSPVGFNSFFGLDESSFDIFAKSSIRFAEEYDSNSSYEEAIKNNKSNLNADKKLSARTKSILAAKKDPMFDPPIRNLRDYVEKVCFGSRVIETQDRRRLRAILAHFFTTQLFDDNFTYVDQKLPNASLFNIPADGGIPIFIQQISSCFRTFDATEALMIDFEAASPLMNWNLSKWVAEPFLSILTRYDDSQDDEEDDNDMYSIDLIGQIDEKPLSLLTQFWINEISSFNKDVKKGLKKLYCEVSNDFISFDTFYDFMKKRREFLIVAFSEVTVKEINLKYLNDISGFFNAYKLHFCLFNDLSSDDVFIEFDFNNKNGFLVKIIDLYLFNGSIKDDILVPIEKKEPFNAFSQIPPMFMFIGEKVERNKYFICPLFKNFFGQNQVFNEGDTCNFVIDVNLNASKGDKAWLLNSTALYVFVPHIFQ